MCSYPMVITLEVNVKKGNLGLKLPNNQQLMLNLFANDSLLFLERELKFALHTIKVFVIALESQCNIEKSRLISLIEEDLINPLC